MSYSIKDFLITSRPAHPSLSPDGNLVAFLNNESGINQLYVLDITKGTVGRLTNFDEPISEAKFSPQESRIIFLTDKGGNENSQIYLYNLKQGNFKQLSTNSDVKNLFGCWSPDGNQIAFSSNERDRKSFDVYILNLVGQKIEPVIQTGGWYEAFSFSHDNKYLVLKKKYSAQNYQLYLVNLSDKSVKQINPSPSSAKYDRAVWRKDNTGFFTITDHEREFKGLAFYELATNKLVYVFNPNWDVEKIDMSADGATLALSVNENGYSKLFLLNIADLAVKSTATPSQSVIKELIWQGQNKTLLLQLESASSPPYLTLLNITTGEVKDIFQNQSALPKKIFVEANLNKYPSYDGLEIPTFSYVLSNTEGKKYPAIVWVHGGPEAQHRPEFDGIIQYLVYSGFAVIAPNIRGSTGYGKTYSSLDNVSLRFNCFEDLEYLHKYIAKEMPFIDIKSIALMGRSYGGFMVLAGLAFKPELWAAGIDIVGISNFITFLQNTSAYRRKQREAEYGDLEKDAGILQKLSPIHQVDKIRAPLLVVHGANDARVPVSEAEQIVREIKNRGGAAELIVYPDEGHQIHKLKNRLDLYSKIIQFLETCLK